MCSKNMYSSVRDVSYLTDHASQIEMHYIMKNYLIALCDYVKHNIFELNGHTSHKTCFPFTFNH